MFNDEVWILLIGALAALCCSQVGVFLVLRRQAMLGDAVSHAILPGLVLGFLIAGRSLPVIFISALGAGLLTAYLAHFIEEQGSQHSDTGIGISFTFLFSLGVILITAFASHVDLDPDCILFGELAFTVFDRWEIGSLDMGPRAFWVQLTVFITLLGFISVAFRRLQLICFDPILATSLGIRTNFWHYALMAAVALACVAAFEAVGVILVVTLLVCPANSAYLFARSLRAMQCWSGLFAILSALLGYYAAVWLDNSIAACMALASGAILITVIVWDNLSRWWRETAA